MIAADTSLAVAAALAWHESHEAAAAALPPGRTCLVAHVAVETYSVLTRLPPPQRVPAELVNAFLRKTFALPPLALPDADYEPLLDTAARESIRGGAVYDALVAATALRADALLLTLDRRALSVYQLIGVRYRLVA